MIRVEFVCAPEDRAIVIEALRPLLGDGDRLVEFAAGMHPGALDGLTLRERVSGRIERVLLQLDLDADDGDAALNALRDLHLQQALDWTCQPLGQRGEIGG